MKPIDFLEDLSGLLGLKCFLLSELLNFIHKALVLCLYLIDLSKVFVVD